MKPGSGLSVLLVDDHIIIRKGCRELLEQADVVSTWEAADGEEAYRAFVEHAPDVVVMDLSMNGVSGLEAIRRMLNRRHNARIVVFSMHDDPIFAARALKAGAVCYVTKTSPPEELVHAVRCAAAGNRHISHDVAQALVLSGMMGKDNPISALTDREFDIFRLMVNGKTAAQIAETLSIAPKSVSNYYGRIKEKLGLNSISELVRLAISQGILVAEPERLD
ncbi:MAG: response regulator [Gammaproteobacteria bacterium]